MKNIHFLILFFLLLVSCSTNGDDKNENKKEELNKEKEEVALTKQQQLKKLYKKTVIPLFKHYKNVNIPTGFKIYIKDHTINAGAALGYVEVSQGLIDYDKTYIQIFALTHELGHIVTLQQAKIISLGNQIPSGKQNNDYKKAEYLADLIAIHLISEQLPKQCDVLVANFNILQSILEGASYTHPSNVDRIKMMQQYIDKSREKSPLTVFENMFKQIWNME